MKLELFYFEGCPFCQYVLKVISNNNIAVTLLDIQQSNQALERLVNDTGRRTVPCLYIDNRPMFESSLIIKWLEENKSKI